MSETTAARNESSEKLSENPPTAWTTEITMQVKVVGSVRVSPDGKRAAFTVTVPVMTEEKSENLTQIWLAKADGSEAFPITHGEKSSQNPKWSPDGKYLAFTSNRKEKHNLYLLRTEGGEAEPLTDVKADINDFEWSPDGTRIAYLMTDAKTEDEEKRDKAKDDWLWVDEDPKYKRIYVLALEKDAEGKREPRQLTTKDYEVTSFDWSPDGRSIAFSHMKTPKADDWVTADISVVDVESGETRLLAGTKAAELQPMYSPDGRWIACRITDDPPRWAFCSTISLIPAEGGEPRTLSTTCDDQPNDEQPGLVGWSADGQEIFFVESHGTTTRLRAMRVADGSVKDLHTGNGLFLEFHLNPSRTLFGFTWQAVDKPMEAFVAPVNDFTPTPVSRVNADLPDLPLGKTEVIRWKSTDGKEIEGLLTYPVGYEAGQRVSLILNVHGGPAGVFTESFIGNAQLYPIATFAARGYAILRPNPRGSSGYGKAFRYANQKDWGGMDYQDLMTGVDHVIAMGVADPERLGVMGWSYGGFMTSWIITQTSRFKAASAGAAVTNLMSFNGVCDIPGFVPCYFGAQSWEDPETYYAHSPMFQVKGVTTPTLVQHPEADIRVPISQGYELYNALKQQGVPTRMIVFPRQPHGPTEPRMKLKVGETNIEWFDKYIGGKG